MPLLLAGDGVGRQAFLLVAAALALAPWMGSTVQAPLRFEVVVEPVPPLVEPGHRGIHKLVMTGKTLRRVRNRS